MAKDKPKIGRIFTVAPSLDSRRKYTLQPGDTIYMVRVNDTIQSIANRFHIHIEPLLVVNQLKTIHLKPGKKLIIPTSILTQRKIAPSGDVIYTVRSGDTLERIAQKFHTSVAEIRILNLMASNTLQKGDQLIMPTPLRG